MTKVRTASDVRRDLAAKDREPSPEALASLAVEMREVRADAAQADQRKREVISAQVAKTLKKQLVKLEWPRTSDGWAGIRVGVEQREYVLHDDGTVTRDDGEGDAADLLMDAADFRPRVQTIQWDVRRGDLALALFGMAVARSLGRRRQPAEGGS